MKTHGGMEHVFANPGCCRNAGQDGRGHHKARLTAEDETEVKGSSYRSSPRPCAVFPSAPLKGRSEKGLGAPLSFLGLLVHLRPLFCPRAFVADHQMENGSPGLRGWQDASLGSNKPL